MNAIEPLPPVVFCGVARNAQEGLSATLDSVAKLAPLFQDWRAAVVTNDNTDSTDARLGEWAVRDHRHKVIRCDGLLAAMPHVVDRITAARNLYLQHLQDDVPAKFQWVMVLDMDGPNVSLEPESLLQAISSCAPEWDGLFANQSTAYYDIYALRHAVWCPNDCWQEVQRASKGLFGQFLMNRHKARFVYSRQYHIPPSHPPIAVKSAFGGAALYKRGILSSCRYGSRDKQGRAVCEHTILHEQLRANGAKLFIAPALINVAPPEHLGIGSGQPFPSGRMAGSSILE